MSKFFDLFKQYSGSTEYVAARDAILEHGENPDLQNNVTGAGVYGYNNQIDTIGYGYDVSKQTGSQIISDFTLAGIFTSSNVLVGGQYHDLYAALQSYGSGGTGNSGWSAVDTEFANAFGADGLSGAQAKELLDVVTPRYEEAVATTLSIYDATSSFGNNGLTELLVSENYNGGNIFGPTQANDIANDNVTDFLKDVLFFNNTQDGTYLQGLENRRIQDLAAAIGLKTMPLSGTTNGVTLQFGQNVTAALDIAQAITKNSSAIASHISDLADSDFSANKLTTLKNNLLANAESLLISKGYYVPQPGDGSTAGEIADSVLTRLGFTIGGSLDAATLQQINAPFADSDFSVGGLVHVPVSAASTIDYWGQTLTPQAGEAYVYDPSSGKLFTVGASLDGHDDGALVIDTAVSGTYATFDKNTYSSFSVDGSGDVTVHLITPLGQPVGVVTFDPADNAGTYSLYGLDVYSSYLGASIPLTGGPIHITDPIETPEEITIDYLNDLGISMTAEDLAQANEDFYTTTASANALGYRVDKIDDAHANAVFQSEHNGDTATGPGLVTITDYDSNNDPYDVVVTPTNIFEAEGDITQDVLSNIQIVAFGAEDSSNNVITLTADQFNSFAHIQNTSAAPTINIFGGGTVSLQGSNVDASFGVHNLVAASWEGTTLIGNDLGSGVFPQILTASLFGDDTLIAGNSAGAQLVAGEGVDTLIGGTGGDNFYANAGLTAGSVVEGDGTGNTLAADGDITGATISGIQTLAGGPSSSGAVISSAQFYGFNSVEGNITLTDSGAYDFTGTGYEDLQSVIAGSNDGTTMIGNGGNGLILTASESGDDTLTIGNGSGSMNAANSFGNNTLTIGSADNTWIDASDSVRQ